jgi:hypothetical protein
MPQMGNFFDHVLGFSSRLCIGLARVREKKKALPKFATDWMEMFESCAATNCRHSFSPRPPPLILGSLS